MVACVPQWEPKTTLAEIMLTADCKLMGIGI